MSDPFHCKGLEIIKSKNHSVNDTATQTKKRLL